MSTIALDVSKAFPPVLIPPQKQNRLNRDFRRKCLFSPVTAEPVSAYPTSRASQTPLNRDFRQYWPKRRFIRPFLEQPQNGGFTVLLRVPVIFAVEPPFSGTSEYSRLNLRFSRPRDQRSSFSGFPDFRFSDCFLSFRFLLFQLAFLIF